jgi:8-oxo-dGTP pyrophosphatase MutT (NUDIX family)
MALDLEEIDRSMSFHSSEATIISCGTVTLDLAQSMVLLIWNKRLQIYQLPKGRKNIGEDILCTALRETAEETGVIATPLRLKIATRATPPSRTVPESSREHEANAEDPQKDGVTDNRLSTEFLGCCRYPDPQSAIPAMKVVFFFAATADSSAPRGNRPREDREKLVPVWTKASEAACTLRFKAESDIVRKALADARRSGYTIQG